MSAASPRRRTSAIMSATTTSTSTATSRLPLSSATKAASKPAAALSSLSGIGRLAKALNPSAQLLGAGLEGGPVHDQAGSHLRNGFDLDQIIGLQGRAGRDQVDDAPAQSQSR